MKKKKLIFLIAGIIILVLLTIFGINIVNRKNKEKIVIKELEKINNLDATVDTIDMNIKSTDKELKIVEEAIKNYYNDYFTLKKNFNENRAEALFNILTPKYLNDNRKKLNNVKKEFEEKNNSFNENIDNLIEMLKDYKIISYIDKDKISEKNYNFYKDLMISDDDKVIIKELEEIKKDNQEKYGYVIEVITLLSEKNASWYVKDDKLYIDGDYLLKKYNELRIKVYELDKSQEV